MSDWNASTTNTNPEDEGAGFGRFHVSGASSLTDRGLELLSMPTASARHLGMEHLKRAHAASDRLATCVLGMCALSGAFGELNEHAGVALLEEAADMGSHRAENHLARYRLSHWEGPRLAPTDGLDGRDRRRVERDNAERVREHRNETRRVWKYLRGPILRGAVTEATHPALHDVYQEIMWRGRVTDDVELDCCMVFGTLGHAHATYLAALAYESGSGGVQSFEVAVRLMYRAMRAGHHDAIVWVRFARRSGRVA